MLDHRRAGESGLTVGGSTVSVMPYSCSRRVRRRCSNALAWPSVRFWANSTARSLPRVSASPGGRARIIRIGAANRLPSVAPWSAACRAQLDAENRGASTIDAPAASADMVQ